MVVSPFQLTDASMILVLVPAVPGFCVNSATFGSVERAARIQQLVLVSFFRVMLSELPGCGAECTSIYNTSLCLFVSLSLC